MSKRIVFFRIIKYDHILISQRMKKLLMGNIQLQVTYDRNHFEIRTINSIDNPINVKVILHFSVCVQVVLQNTVREKSVNVDEVATLTMVLITFTDILHTLLS